LRSIGLKRRRQALISLRASAFFCGVDDRRQIVKTKRAHHEARPFQIRSEAKND
jgi:hypothetical protein